MMGQRWEAIVDLIRLDRPYGTLLLLLPVLWSLMIASEGLPTLTLILIFSSGAFLMRSAGCVMNDLADRDLDRRVSRTKERPLPSRRMTTGEALVVLGILLTLAALLLFFLDPLTRWLSLGGLAVAGLYPFTKRYIHLPQLIMGIAFGWGALMAWTAVRHTLELPALLTFAATLFWATGYDTIYALLDRDDDIKVGIKSTAILFGRYTWIALAALFGLASFFLLLLGLRTERASIYYFTLVLITLSFGYQVFKVRGNPDKPMTFSLFKSHVGIGVLVLAGIALDFWTQRWTGGIP